jgi:hypothetical protein
VRIAINKELQASAGPELPESYQKRARLLQNLPIRLLQRRIQIAAPLTAEQIQLVKDRIKNDQLPCGEDPFPSCEKFIRFLRTQAQVCRGLPDRQRPRYCARLARFIQNVVIPAATAAAEAGETLGGLQLNITPPALPPGG